MGKVIQFKGKDKKGFNEEFWEEAQEGASNVKVFLDMSEEVHGLVDAALIEHTMDLKLDSEEMYGTQGAIIMGTLIPVMIRSMTMFDEKHTSEMVYRALASARKASKEGCEE